MKKPLFQIQSLSRRFGSRILFEDASLTVDDGQKIGVMGRNGAGKSTLARILAGQETPDSGQVVFSTDAKIGFLEQNETWNKGETVLDFLMRKSSRESWECGRMAARFGLKNALLESPIDGLAGGYRMRVKLTELLLHGPTFLILDEPTNYLDLSTLLHLEDFLVSFNGGYMIISHDREFLRKTCQQTLDVEHGRLFLYPGPLEEYLEFKQEQIEQKIAFNKNIEARQKELQSFIDRFRAQNTKAAQARSKQKQLDRLEKAEIEKPGNTVIMKIPAVDDRPGIALQVEDLSTGYQDKRVSQNVRFQVERGWKLAILGDNGQGKTTLLRTIAGDLDPLLGTYKWNPSLRIAKYAQHVYESLPEDSTILKELKKNAHPDTKPQEILDMAGAFLFSGDDVDKPIKVLSGGERSRVALAGLLLSRCDVLLLDEPTNHLDIETVESLASGLSRFAGTVLFISHDRTFVNMTADRILELSDGTASLYPGSYEDYVYSLQQRAHQDQLQTAKDQKRGASPTRHTNQNELPEEEKSPEVSKGSSTNKNRHLARKEARSKLNKRKKESEQLELQIQNLEKEKDQYLKEITDHPEGFSREKSDRLTAITEQLESLEGTWLELESELEALSKEAET